MLFLIDGYNATMRSEKVRRGSKESQRDALVRRLNVNGRRLLGAGDIVCVFDARASVMRSVEEVGSVCVVYAPDADAEIVRHAAQARGEVTAVTDDLRLRARLSQDVGRHVRFRDTSCLFGEEAAAPCGRERPRHGGPAARGPGHRGHDSRRADRLSARDEATITAELEREWLAPQDDG